jgi:sigma-B regulation protein RsbU (phosphoserine phosphatase)
MVVYYNYTEDALLDSTIKRAEPLLQSAALQVAGKMSQVDVALANNMWKIKMSDYKDFNTLQSGLISIEQNVLKSNPIIIGGGIAFIPDYIKGQGKWYFPYSIKENGKISTTILKDESYDYFGMDWFLIPIRLNKDYWSEPYYDEGGGNIMMTTCAHIVRDNVGKAIGVMTADVSLDSLTQFVESMKPLGPDSYSFMLSRHGYYLSNVDHSKIMNETVFITAFQSGSKDFEKAGHDMIEGKSGMVKFKQNKKSFYAFYTNIPNVSWSICTVTPDSYILGDLRNITNRIIILFIIGLLLVNVLTYKVIAWMTKPIAGFSKSAGEIADGNFNTILPVVNTEDELMTLHNSIDHMRHSLQTYIDELQVTTANKERMEKELSIAHDIQMGMLPKIFPPFPDRRDVDLYAILKPAKEVGGDLYDFFVREQKLYFAIGDVSGKGVPASLIMAITSSLFRTLTQIDTEPSNIIKAMNSPLCENNPSNMFVTMIIGVLDLNSGNLKVCNAGHNPMILSNKEGVHYLNLKKNLPVGLMGGFDYKADSLTISPGDKLVLYTDGVTEAESETKELFGEKRLLELVEQNRQSGVRDIINVLMDGIAGHVKQAVQSDDITIMDIQYKTLES